MKQYSYRDVSDWFLSKESMPPKKMQKLTYYAEAWANALHDQSLINDTVFEAWLNGPVSPQLYQDYEEYGWSSVPKKESNESLFDDDALDLLESVWMTYGDHTANSIDVLTRTEMPWRKAREGYEGKGNSTNIIDPEDMKEYYKSIYIGG